jgi:hypothetical protein
MVLGNNKAGGAALTLVFRRRVELQLDRLSHTRLREVG